MKYRLTIEKNQRHKVSIFWPELLSLTVPHPEAIATHGFFSKMRARISDLIHVTVRRYFVSFVPSLKKRRHDFLLFWPNRKIFYPFWMQSNRAHKISQCVRLNHILKASWEHFTSYRFSGTCFESEKATRIFQKKSGHLHFWKSHNMFWKFKILKNPKISSFHFFQHSAINIKNVKHRNFYRVSVQYLPT